MKRVICVSSILLMLAMAGVITSCMSVQNLGGKTVEVPLVVSSQSVPTTYRNLEKTVRLNITGIENVMYDDSNLSERKRSVSPQYIFIPSVKEFAADATANYMQKKGFDITPNGDFRFDVNVHTFKMLVSKFGIEYQMVINYKLLDGAGQTVVPSSTASYRTTPGVTRGFGIDLGRAYAKALNNVNWDRVAKCLMIANTPNQEANAQVRGAGDTALEHTVIRWYITSAPQGADVSWRVISSTPDVSNTNSCFVGSTPYETTESFDIKGMTYNNSGNVQIEVSCEKPGYITQRKRFNLRQAIDQKEISAKFNLIKDE